jgi:hypothetical protein
LTLVLLDTNAYLRLAKRVKPLLGKPFGQKEYVLTILKAVEDEVHRSTRLKFRYPWFDDPPLAEERLAKRVRLSQEEKTQIEAMQSVLRAHVLENTETYTTRYRSPPSPIDCFCLAYGQVRPAIVVTDDLGMHQLAKTFEIPLWYGHELLKKMLTAKMVDRELVIAIYEALDTNNDIDDGWRTAKHTAFKKIFGPKA